MKRFRNICVTSFLLLGLYVVGICLHIWGTIDISNTLAVWRASGDAEKTDIEFTVCEAGQLPKELVEIIESKKEQPFRLTFTTREYMYIVVGYGAQQRGGCAVTVNQLYRTEQAVHIDTNLVGVEGEPIQIDGLTYPYVAVRCENQNLPVVYE